MVYTDESRSYTGLPREHDTVKHSAGEYVKGDASTNGMESFWSLFKKGYHGTFHHLSEKHLDRYVREFTGRNNIRDLDTIDQMAVLARGFVGKRLTYRGTGGRARRTRPARRAGRGSGTLSELDEAKRQVEALRESISRLCAAVGHITASLDLETVLRGILESARGLTGARYGAIATIDEAGQPRDFVTSGFTDEGHRLLAEWPDGPRLFEHFRDLPGALRLPDAPAYVRALGFDSDRLPWGTFQGMPMHHRDVHVGNFYLVEKEGGEAFTDEDEEVLGLLASHAASAIANARAHRAEQRARADLEALVETSPVGVVVFDARSGAPVSLNREARRIVESLRSAGSPAEQLLEVMTFRRADGREIALGELPLAATLSGGETVRAEEIVLSVPDGRSVTTLVNATPIHGEDGAVVSMVVTLQDLAPLQELERMRAEFLGLVSHELRAPLTSIKGSTAAVLGAGRVFGTVEMREFFRIIDGQADHMIGLVADLLDAGRIDAGTLSVAPEPTEVAVLVDQARNTFLSGGARHTVLIDLPPGLAPVMADRQRIVQVLNNLFSNAARHAPESAPIRVSAVRDGGHVAVAVADEGRGVPPELLPRLFQKHTGAGRAGGAPGGPGLGLAICKGLVEAHGGRIRAESAGAGRGSTFTFTLPVAGDAGEDAVPAAPRRAARARPARGASPRPSSWWTMTPRRCATSATRSPRRATPQW